MKELHTPSPPSYTPHRFPEKQPGVFLGVCEQPPTLSASSVCLISLPLPLSWLSSLRRFPNINICHQNGTEEISLSPYLITLPTFPCLSVDALGFSLSRLSLPLSHTPTYPPSCCLSFCPLCLPLSRLLCCLLGVTFDPTLLACVSWSHLSKTAFSPI